MPPDSPELPDLDTPAEDPHKKGKKPAKEAPKAEPLRDEFEEDAPNTPERLAQLKKEAEMSLASYVESECRERITSEKWGRDVVFLDSGYVEVADFKLFKDIVADKLGGDPQGFDYANLYLEYLSQEVQTPMDVWSVINPPVLRWDKGILPSADPLFSAETTLALGSGDCDNISWVAKVLLDKLGQRNGIDYHARLIISGVVTHGATVYTNEAGQLCSIDQGYHHENVQNLREASSIFEEKQTIGELQFAEGTVFSHEVCLQKSLDLEGKVDKKTMVAKTAHKDASKFDPEKELPTEWKEYEMCQVFFLDNSCWSYQKGQMCQINHPDGSIEIIDPSSGKLTQKDQADGTQEVLDRDSGKLVEKDYPDGSAEFFDLTTGKLSQKDYPDGSKEFFDPSTGKLEEKDYPDGNLEFFAPASGQLYQKNHPDGSKEYFDPSTGKLSQKDYPDGSKEGFNMETGKRTSYFYPENSKILADDFQADGITIRAREYRSATTETPYRMLFCSEKGVPFQIEQWDGKQIPYNGQPIYKEGK